MAEESEKARIWTFGGLGGTRSQIQPSQLGEFIVYAGDFIDAFQMLGPGGNGQVRYGGAGGQQEINVPGGIGAGMKYILMQSVIHNGIQFLNYIEWQDPISKKIYTAGKKVSNPASEWVDTGKTYTLVWVGHGDYVDGIGFSEVLG